MADAAPATSDAEGGSPNLLSIVVAGTVAALGGSLLALLAARTFSKPAEPEANAAQDAQAQPKKKAAATGSSVKLPKKAAQKVEAAAKAAPPFPPEEETTAGGEEAAAAKAKKKKKKKHKGAEDSEGAADDVSAGGSRRTEDPFLPPTTTEAELPADQIDTGAWIEVPKKTPKAADAVEDKEAEARASKASDLRRRKAAIAQRLQRLEEGLSAGGAGGSKKEEEQRKALEARAKLQEDLARVNRSIQRLSEGPKGPSAGDRADAEQNEEDDDAAWWMHWRGEECAEEGAWEGDAAGWEGDAAWEAAAWEGDAAGAAWDGEYVWEATAWGSAWAWDEATSWTSGSADWSWSSSAGASNGRAQGHQKGGWTQRGAASGPSRRPPKKQPRWKKSGGEGALEDLGGEEGHADDAGWASSSQDVAAQPTEPQGDWENEQDEEQKGSRRGSPEDYEKGGKKGRSKGKGKGKAGSKLRAKGDERDREESSKGSGRREKGREKGRGKGKEDHLDDWFQSRRGRATAEVENHGARSSSPVSEVPERPNDKEDSIGGLLKTMATAGRPNWGDSDSSDEDGFAERRRGNGALQGGLSSEAARAVRRELQRRQSQAEKS